MKIKKIYQIRAVKLQHKAEFYRIYYTLLAWLRRQKTPAGLAKRARAMLLLADGQTVCDTSRLVGLGERHLRKWAKRFIAQGIHSVLMKWCCVDEKTSLQPRPGTAKTLPAQPGVPVRVENEYGR